MEGRHKNVWDLSCPRAAEGLSLWFSVWPQMLWLHWHSFASPCPTPHTSGSSLDDSVTVLGGSQKPDHFVVYMSLEPCASEPIRNTPKEGEIRGSEMDSQTPGQGFIAEPGSLVFSQREGTIRDHHAQLTKAMSCLPASRSCLPRGRSLVRLVRLDPLGEGASTDPRLAFCSLEVQWEGWGADR